MIEKTFAAGNTAVNDVSFSVQVGLTVTIVIKHRINDNNNNMI
jgi:hypothetical protein